MHECRWQLAASTTTIAAAAVAAAAAAAASTAGAEAVGAGSELLVSFASGSRVLFSCLSLR